MLFRDNIKIINSTDINETYKIIIQIKDKYNIVNLKNSCDKRIMYLV